jgi:AcrR family transcriptional regulator
MKTRQYTLRKRAESQDGTRQRIVEATVAVHQRLGPRHATISAIAAEAGVQRLTVYRHFPDESALFAACTSRWLEDNPPPDPADWEGVPIPSERLHAALLALYAYYRRTERMWSVSYRDVDEVPALQAPMQGVEDYLDTLQRGLVAAWPSALRTKALKAIVAHCLRFATWQSLVRQGGLSQADATAACVQWVVALADGGKGTA